METDKEPLKAYISPDIILRLLVNKEDRKWSEQMFIRAENDNNIQLITSTFALFEALSCIEDNEKIDTMMLVQILKVMRIETATDVQEGYDAFNEKRKKKIREVAFSKEGGMSAR